jgi:hypothetical protein
MSEASDAFAELCARIRATPSNPNAIETLLDSLAEPLRISAIRGLSGGDQRTLWSVVEGYRPLHLIDLVPPQVPAMAQVRHFGRNSQPAFTIFEKRFYRPAGADAQTPDHLCGANFQRFAPITGYGYFVVVAEPNGTELCVDYRRLPEAAPSGWPPIRSNERGISRLVYGFMTDTLRRVSQHVTVGSAARHGRTIGLFVLCRETLISG